MSVMSFVFRCEFNLPAYKRVRYELLILDRKAGKWNVCDKLEFSQWKAAHVTCEKALFPGFFFQNPELEHLRNNLIWGWSLFGWKMEQGQV